MERRVRLGVLSGCLVVAALATLVGSAVGGTAHAALFDVVPVLGVTCLLTYGLLLRRSGGKDAIDAVRGLDSADRRAVRRAWQHPDSAPPHLREVAHEHATARARGDELLGWVFAAASLWCLTGVAVLTSTPLWLLVAGVAPALAGFVADDLGRRRRRGAVELADVVPPHAS